MLNFCSNISARTLVYGIKSRSHRLQSTVFVSRIRLRRGGETSYAALAFVKRWTAAFGVAFPAVPHVSHGHWSIFVLNNVY